MANRYRPDGAFSAVGLVQALLLGSLAGIVVGYILGFVGARWFSLLLLWPALMGLAAGVAVHFIVKKTAIRAAWLALLLGGVCGVLAYAASHHVAYVLAQHEFAQEMSKKGIEDSGALLDMALMEKTGSSGFVGFLKLEAEQGVSISHHGSNNIKFTGTGAWIVFLIELLISVGLGALLPYSAAREPYCSSCQKWYQQKTAVRFKPSLTKKEALTQLENDRMIEMASLVTKSSESEQLLFQIKSCPQCDMADSVVELRRSKIDKKGKLKESTLAKFSIPQSDVRQFLNRVEETFKKNEATAPAPAV